MRPKQKEYRKREREAGLEGGEEENDRLPGGQALPVADLPDDFDGEAEDGATYLALALRANAGLPNFKTVPNPYRQSTPPPLIGPIITMNAQSQPEAGPSRHPALPRDSWRELFPVHFRNYRKSIAKRWPPDTSLPYPSDWPPTPLTRQPNECRYYIQGHPRARIKLPTQLVEEEMNEEEAMNADPALALVDDGIGNDPDDGEEDEEAAMNADDEESAANMDDEEAAMNMDTVRVQVVESVISGSNTGKKVDSPQPKKAKYGFEPEKEKHKPRIPLVSALQTFNSSEMIQLLGHITKTIEDALSEAETLLSFPETPSTPSTTSSEPPETIIPDPFPILYSQWVFSLLLVLDQHLDSTHIYTLRELARVIMRVGAWRWVYAVTHGEVSEGDGWVLGGKRKESEGKDVDEKGVDEVLARCWVGVYAIAEGWGQRDLLDDLEKLFT